MALILFDTNIFIDMLNGVHEATVELGSYDNPAISIITYMELRSGEIPRPKDKPICSRTHPTQARRKRALPSELRISIYEARTLLFSTPIFAGGACRAGGP